MTVARRSRITTSSTENFERAIQEGLARASKTIRGITGLDIIDFKVKVENGKIAEYRVTMDIIFLLED